MRRWGQQFTLFTLLMAVSVIGCSGDLFMTPDEAKRDWEEFKDHTMVATTDHQIENEVAGKKPPGGVESWNKHWLLRIKHMRKSPEENQKFIDYIIERRRQAGLPPLEGYPPEDQKSGKE